MSVIHNVLPGEDGETRWFGSLNSFEQAETLRQVAFKRRRWPSLPDGGWAKMPNRSYPHILPEGELLKAFFDDIAVDVVDYCTQSDIAIHSEALNLRSSQVCCFNVLFPLRMDHALAQEALVELLPEVTEVDDIEFEWTGPAGTTEWLGEPDCGKRGQNRTSIDAAIWWQREDRPMLTLCEWKYTEREYGTCGGYQSSGNKNQQHCRSQLANAPDYEDGCYLTEDRHDRHYWTRFPQAGINLQPLVDGSGCPLRGPFYQLARQYLVAAYTQDMMPDHGVHVVSLSFGKNELLHTGSVEAGTVEDIWNKALTTRHEPFRVVHVESIVETMRSIAASKHSAWLDYLGERYGL
jgi:hypothetical protein